MNKYVVKSNKIVVYLVCTSDDDENFTSIHNSAKIENETIIVFDQHKLLTQHQQSRQV